ncbi:MAG: hypothetical protein CV081_05080 [Nitrospira sp. LK265]|nr:hypothetical protein [Nitrospira sp. LK265]
MLGNIAASEGAVFANFCTAFNLKRKRVVEIGGMLPESEIEPLQVDSWVSVDPLCNTSEHNLVRRVRSTADHLPAETGKVDFVFSSNALEHIERLEVVMHEVHRVLIPGGVLYTHFGPIWSGPDGHHLETMLDGQAYEFWREPYLPHWGHLALDPPEYQQFIEPVWGIQAHKITDWVYDSDWLNRLFFEDYLQLAVNSGLSLVHLETCDKVDYPYKPHKSYRLTDAELLSLAMDRTGRQRNLMARDVLMVLRKV